MDGEHFDHLARVAAAGSRRACLRAFVGALLAGVVARTHAAAAQTEGTTAGSGGKEPATLPLGPPCEVDAQCAVDHADGFETFHDRDPAPICGDNGIDKDGLGNCCKPAGEFAFCRSDADCCDDAVCVSIKQLGTTCRRTQINLAIGMSCTSTAECHGQTLGYNMLCDSNGAGQRVCCLNGGRLPCVEDGDCCGTALCHIESGEEDGLCLDPVDGGLPLGAACLEGGLLCSQTGGSTICADNGDWFDLDLNCCRMDGGWCRQDQDCCAGFICVDGACAAGNGTAKRWGDIGGAQPSERGPAPPQGSAQPAPPSAPLLPAASYLPAAPDVRHAECFQVSSRDSYTYVETVAALQQAGLSQSQVDGLGWQDGAYVVFSCEEPPVGRASQLDVGIHQFQDSQAAQQALPYYSRMYELGNNSARSCDAAKTLVICVSGHSLSGSPLSDVQFVLQQVVASAS